MFVFADSKEKKVISQINLGSPVKSTPIVANGALLVATETHLYAIAEGAKPVQAGSKGLPNPEAQADLSSPISHWGRHEGEPCVRSTTDSATAAPSSTGSRTAEQFRVHES